ncbi:DUF4352 domain-containing protein [Chitinophaga lutea]|nr:DUF4352 domain-containing protein [Chitinophaga lutea]
MSTTANRPGKKSGIGKVILIVTVIIIIVIGVIVNIGRNKDAVSKPAYPTVGQILKTGHFEVTVNKVEVVQSLNTGSVVADITVGDDSKLLVFNVTYKNIDAESRLIADGEIHISYNGKDYNFDRPETILADGYGLFMQHLKPDSAKTFNQVYLLPKEVTGIAYYMPGRAEKEQKIVLGEIK